VAFDKFLGDCGYPHWGIMGLSTDSSGPALQALWKDRVRAGAYAATWEENVAEWQRRLAGLRQSPHYREPPQGRSWRQPTLF
jgi:hypothetical protein